MNIANQLRPAQTAATLGVSVSTLWNWVISKPGFPQPRRLSARCTVFDAGEIAIYLHSVTVTSSTIGQRLMTGRTNAAIRKATTN